MPDIGLISRNEASGNDDDSIDLRVQVWAGCSSEVQSNYLREYL
jgi:hypothetical protein